MTRAAYFVGRCEPHGRSAGGDTISAGCIPGPGASPNGGEKYPSAAPVGFARESAPCRLQIRISGGIRNPFAKTQGGLARRVPGWAFFFFVHRNRRRHALARWLSVSPQLRRMG